MSTRDARAHARAQRANGRAHETRNANPHAHDRTCTTARGGIVSGLGDTKAGADGLSQSHYEVTRHLPHARVRGGRTYGPPPDTHGLHARYSPYRATGTLVSEHDRVVDGSRRAVRSTDRHPQLRRRAPSHRRRAGTTRPRGHHRRQSQHDQHRQHDHQRAAHATYPHTRLSAHPHSLPPSSSTLSKTPRLGTPARTRGGPPGSALALESNDEDPIVARHQTTLTRRERDEVPVVHSWFVRTAINPLLNQNPRGPRHHLGAPSGAS